MYDYLTEKTGAKVNNMVQVMFHYFSFGSFKNINPKMFKYLFKFKFKLKRAFILQVDYIFDTLYIQQIYNFTLPEWTKDVFPDKMVFLRDMVNKFHYHNLFKTLVVYSLFTILNSRVLELQLGLKK